MTTCRSTIRECTESCIRQILQELYSSWPGATATTVRSEPGILIFSRRQQLRYINRRALELMGPLASTETSPAHDILWAWIQETRTRIETTLDQRSAAQIWESFELEEPVFNVPRTINIRGFGVADRNSYEDSCILIILDRVDHRQALASPAQTVAPSLGSRTTATASQASTTRKERTQASTRAESDTKTY